MVMGESMRLVGIGVAVGLATALWAGRYVKAVLYGLPAHDPLTIAAAVGADRRRLGARRLPAGAARVEGRSDGGVAPAVAAGDGSRVRVVRRTGWL